MPQIRPKRIADFIVPFRVKPGSRVRLPHDFDTGPTQKVQRDEAKRLLKAGVEMLADYQARLAAQDTQGLLVILQAMDAAGKDGTIRHVMSGVNPQGVRVHSFKIPSSTDLDHDYLWRYAQRAPARGDIGIFNRSYYEEVLVVRVHSKILDGQKLPPHSRKGDIWQRRFREINDWERYLTDQGFRIVKIFLNLGKEEQRRRFLSRIDEPEKNWKFSANDARERTYWNDYQKAFSEVLSNTSTDWAPWYVVPADDKPFARVAAAAVLVNALIEMDPRYPRVSKEARAALLVAKADLEGDAPKGSRPDPNVPRGEPAADVSTDRGAAATDGDSGSRTRTAKKRSKTDRTEHGRGGDR
jgi:PPK2 family polyphosphate:nucleotide phosphotransferase